ncbi:MAG TPA: hypothetical protein DD434_09720 [Bacteroidales bacterium]|nr:hypothetical protein [Bacteroidales bacterium]
MKKTLLILVALIFAVSLNSHAEDFSAVNDGDTIYYKITSSVAPLTVAVSFKGNEFYTYQNEYTGSVTIPDSVLYNGNYYKVTSIGDSAFYNCSGLTYITIPNSVTEIDGSAFKNCSGLTSVTIPKFVSSIGNNAFNSCNNLSTVYFNAINCNYMGNTTDPVFAYCDNLSTVLIGDSVIIIPDAAFYRCSGLTSITIPSSLISIGKSAFYRCSSLTSITIPNSVTSIDNNAFQYCSGLTSFTIPDSITLIDTLVFNYCSGLTSITIPNSVTSICQAAFHGCTGLTSVTIPNSVNSIGSSAFTSCRGLDSIIIPNSVTSIGSFAFSYCNGLTTITIPNSINTIANNTFNNCRNLTSLNIPSSCDTIESMAFSQCVGLTYIRINATIPPTIQSNSFYNVNRAIPVYVPCSSVSSYQAAPYWNTFTNYIGRDIIYIDTTICDGETYNFNGTIIDSAGVYSYVNGCDSVILTLNINPTPDIPYDLILSNVTDDTYEISWQGSAESYDIYRDNSFIANVDTTFYLDTFNILHGLTYCYKVKAKNGDCESAFSDSLWFEVGLDCIEQTNITSKLYPNPTSNKSYLEIEGLNSDADVLVYDIMGRIIKTYKVNQGTKALDIDLSRYAKGVYSIRIVNESINQTKKLIVQ